MQQLDEFWKHYGFEQNPFATEPLSDYSSLRVEDLYVCREGLEDAIDFTSHAIIEGEEGVGRTTFVHRQHYLFHQKKLNYCFEGEKN